MRVLQVLPLLAGVSSAFLVPAKVSDEVAEAFRTVSNALTEKLNGNPVRQTIKLDCKDCPYLVGETTEGIKAYKKIDNALVFDIEASQTEQHALRINGLEIFQPTPFQHLKAVQIPEDDEHVPVQNIRPMVNLNYEIFVSAVSPSTRNVRLHILSVDNIPTHRKMDIIDLTVVANEQGILKIAKVEARHPTKSEASAAQCQMNMLCRWKAYFKDKLLGAKEQPTKGSIEEGKGRGKGKRPGCFGRPMPGHHSHKGEDHKDGHHKGEHGKDGHHKSGHHKGGHHGSMDDKFHGQAHPHHHHRHRYSNFFKFVKIVAWFAVSIGMGVVAGFMISIVGCLVGHIVVVTYRYATGKEQKSFDWDLLCSKRCAAAKSQPEEAEGLLDEKIAVEEASEELPAYTDSEGVLRGDEKENL